MRPVLDLKSFLCGSWLLDRSLLDRRHNISGKLIGRADFVPSGCSLLCEEQGSLTFGSHHGPAQQRLTFLFPNGDAQASVRFSDGRAFYELDLSQGQSVVSHSCNPDFYEGRFAVTDPDRWESTWKVTGPRKEQEIVTLYTRLR